MRQRASCVARTQFPIPILTRIAIVVLVAGATLAGCSLFVDLQGLHDGMGKDTGDVVNDGVDVVPGDGMLEDASSSAGTDARGCSSIIPSPKFCKDFDDQNPITFDWDKVSRVPSNPTTAAELDTAFAWSAPQSARVRL